jgi:hypothetical protein
MPDAPHPADKGAIREDFQNLSLNWNFRQKGVILGRMRRIRAKGLLIPQSPNI